MLPIVDGWNILDDNLLARPRAHVEAVFAMLRRQNRRIEFTGGVEALSLQDYQVELLTSLRPRPIMFFAYDPGDAFETLEHAARRLIAAGVATGGHNLRAYVLVGYPRIPSRLPSSACRPCCGSASRRSPCCGRPVTPSQMKYMPEEGWRRQWTRRSCLSGEERAAFADLKLISWRPDLVR